jgi:glycosyltransferase involved in cell wall biosynthesis
MFEMNLEFTLALLYSPKHPFKETAFPEFLAHKINLAYGIEPNHVGLNVHGLLDPNRSLFMNRFFDATFLQKLTTLIEDLQPEIIHFESLYAAVYLPYLKRIFPAKLVLRTHNIEHELWADRLKNSCKLKRLVLNKQVIHLKEEENQILEMADGIISIAQQEKAYVETLNKSKKVIFLPTSMPASPMESTLSADFFHLGAMDWEPNKRAMDWFIEHVWQSYVSANSQVFHLAGKNLNPSDYQHTKQVENHGEIADSQEFMCKKGILVLPLTEGKGLRIKVLEAGNLGVPIISTRKGVEGIGLTPEIHYLEAQTAIEFTSQMERLAKDVSLRQTLGSNIRSYMLENFDPDTFNRKLLEFYQSI